MAAKDSGVLLWMIFVFHHLKNRKCRYKTEEMLIKSRVSSKTLIFGKLRHEDSLKRYRVRSTASLGKRTS